MSSSPSNGLEAPPALAAFLRGVERRGSLFGELQCGDSDAGDTALVAAMRAFRNQAAGMPMADWPRRFWTLLAATPQLRGAAPGAAWPAGTQALAGTDPLPRQALLMRLAAGLDEDDAASVLNLTQADYRQALAAACPRDGEGRPDAEAWRGLAETIQLHLRELSPQRLARLAELREAALGGGRPRPGTGKVPGETTKPAAARTRRRGRGWLLAVLLLLATLVTAVWIWPWLKAQRTPGVQTTSDALGVLTEVQVTTEALPLEAPASRFDAAFALANHPDAALLLDPEGQAIAQQADLYAWYAAGRAAVSAETAAEAPTTDQASVAETSDAQL